MGYVGMRVVCERTQKGTVVAVEPPASAFSGHSAIQLVKLDSGGGWYRPKNVQPVA